MGIARVEIFTDLDELLSLEDENHSHIIERDEYQSADARILEARVNGTPVTALCGFTWVPSKDPMKYPVCPKCKELVGMAASLRH